MLKWKRRVEVAYGRSAKRDGFHRAEPRRTGRRPQEGSYGNESRSEGRGLPAARLRGLPPDRPIKLSRSPRGLPETSRARRSDMPVNISTWHASGDLPANLTWSG